MNLADCYLLLNIGRAVMKNVILGAGIAGLSANHFLKLQGIDSSCYERESAYGGLCASFYVDKFCFDKFVHLSFTNNEEVKKVFAESTKCYVHRPEALNYADGLWIRHPVQNNLYKLSTEEKVKIITSFVNKPENREATNYEEWLKIQYGTYFSERYPMRYTRKYWGVEARELGTKWTDGRMYIPQLQEMLYSALEEKTPNVFYAKEMRYPFEGGFQSFLLGIVDEERIKYKKNVVRIDEKEKLVFF